MFTLWYMVFHPILFISQQQEFFHVIYIKIRFVDIWLATFNNLLQLSHVRATLVMADQLAPWSDNLQAATKNISGLKLLYQLGRLAGQTTRKFMKTNFKIRSNLHSIQGLSHIHRSHLRVQSTDDSDLIPAQCPQKAMQSQHRINLS